MVPVCVYPAGASVMQLPGYYELSGKPPIWLSLFALFDKQKTVWNYFPYGLFFACLYQSATAGWSISSSGGRSSSSNSSSREAS